MVEIRYCAKCGWLARSAWMAQELLATFGKDIGGVALVPSDGGTFEVRAGGELVWSRAETGRFPDVKELKRAVRDAACPGRDLGFSGKSGSMDKKLIRIGKAAAILGVRVETLRKWEASGELLPTRKTKAGTRYYSVAELTGATALDAPTICYARVSSHDRKEDLDRPRWRGIAPPKDGGRKR